MNGNSHILQNHVNEGKAVLVDISVIGVDHVILYMRVIQ